MKKILKIFLLISLLLLIISISVVAYMLRPQEIDVGLIPNEFRYCGQQIWGGNEDYQRIVKWLQENRHGWSPNWHTHYAGDGYIHPAFRVVIFDEFVAVSYKTDSSYPQFTKKFKHGLVVSCESNS
jgi:hypothetical protein